MKTTFNIKSIMRFIKSFKNLCLILAYLMTLSIQAQALTIKSVRTGVHPDKTRIVLDLDKQTQYNAFTLTAPNRLVVDLPTSNIAPNVETFKNTIISSVRLGKINETQSRLVMDLTNPSYILTAFPIAAQGAKSDRLVIDVKHTSSEQQAKSRSSGKSFGTLKTAATETNTQQTIENISRAYLTSPITAPQYTPPPPQKPVQQQAYKKPTIVIDAGHGGQDPGAIGAHGTFEKKVTLAVAKELEKQLKATGRYNVHLTRSTDKYIKLRRRVQIAREHHADLFISLHADSIDKKNVRGASLYTISEKASDAQTAKLARNENKADLIADMDLSNEGEEVASILIDLAMRDTVNQSRFLANTMVTALSSNQIKTLETAHRHAGFAVLKAPDIPSVLIEMGFMSNSYEEKLLMQSSYRTKIATGIKKGIDNYFLKTRENLSR